MKWMIAGSDSVIVAVIPLIRMPKLSIRSLLLLVVYFSICASIYVTQNSVAGWIIVIATAILIATSMIHAFNKRDPFALGFSIFAMAWLLICFGYSFDTSRTFKGWQFQQPIFRAMRLGKTSPEIESYVYVERYTIHHFFRSDNGMRHLEDTVMPSYGNALRCFLCVTSLLVGLIGGTIFRFFMKPKPRAG